jgi:hypothetical protein
MLLRKAGTAGNGTAQTYEIAGDRARWIADAKDGRDYGLSLAITESGM